MPSTSHLRASRRSLAILVKTPQCRTFTASTPCLINPLFNLSHFSQSKEAQYLSKERKIPRTEFHPYLELIRSSEVDPFAPAPGASPTVVAALKRAQTGQSDMQTAYSLAISNLIQQLQYTRKEALQAHAALARIQDRYRREERNTFIIMLSTVALLSLILIKTNAVEDLKDYARDATSHWKGFDWEWFGNPPSHRSSGIPQTTPTSIRTEIPPAEQTKPASRPSNPILPIEAQSDQRAQAIEVVSERTSVIQPQKRWLISRLFWAIPT